MTLHPQDTSGQHEDKHAFDHACTPPELASLNLKLHHTLSQTPLDEVSLKEIIDTRANLVETLLNNLEEAHKRRFASLETRTNDAILALVSEQKKHAQNALGKVSKASKAIKKYHQV